MDPADEFDPDRYRDRTPVAVPAVAAAPRHHRQPRRGEYLGPVPWDWLALAARLPGKTLAVGLVLWHLKHLRKRETFAWGPSKAKSLGIKRHVAYRALQRLEAAGLVTVQRHQGRCPVVTILQARTLRVDADPQNVDVISPSNGTG